MTDYVEENLSGDLTLAELSGVAHMSPFHFSRVFKLSTGLSPHRYVVRRRIERAKRLLADSELPLHEVARAAGFADQSHLARHFRLRLGTTARSFRLAFRLNPRKKARTYREPQERQRTHLSFPGYLSRHAHDERREP